VMRGEEMKQKDSSDDSRMFIFLGEIYNFTAMPL
jgi:hypothetical protein